MTTSAVTPPAYPAAPARRKSLVKAALWVLMGIATLVVVALVEYPYFGHPNPNRARVLNEKLIFLPHAVCGLVALLIGPFQFSTRLRQRNLRLHRILGKVYVGSVVIAACSAIVISHHLDIVDQPETYIFFETCVQAGFWLLATVAAFITVRNRNIAVHRQWMIRSYTFTFIFVSSRLPIPALVRLSDAGFVIFLFILVAVSLIVPDIYFSWRELTTRRTR
jgi:uncharacterized membrane protein